MTRIRFSWPPFGEFVLADPETHFDEQGDPYFRAWRYWHNGRVVNIRGDFPFAKASSIETLPDQLELAA